MDIPEIKKQAAASMCYGADSALSDPCGECDGCLFRANVPILVTALEEAQAACEEYENRWIAAQEKLGATQELAMGMGTSSSVQVQDFRDELLAILGESQ
jgi:hypothetical protein